MAAARPRLPPGPRLGILSTSGFMRDPARATARWRSRYGDTFTIPAMNGHIVATVDPELARLVFQLRSEDVAVYGDHVFAPAMGDASLFVLSGADHRAERKLLTPPFHGERMRAYRDMMEEVALSVSRDWPSRAVVDLQEELNRVSSEVILRCVFAVEEAARLEQASTVVRRFVSTFRPAALFFPWLQSRLLPGWRRFEGARAILRDLLRDEVERRWSEGSRGDDILSLLLDARYDDGSAMEPAVVVDELVTLLVAGHETTTVAMTWALYWLMAHEDDLARVHAAIDDPETDTSEAEWLDLVCRETLRLHPIASDIVRTTRRQLELGPWVLPAGHGVGVVITGIHAREDLYPDPDAFRPERFRERSFGPHEYMPFGGGVRRCIGASFAMFEMKVVLTTLLGRFAFERVSSEPVGIRRRNVVMGPDRPILVRVRER